MLPYLLTYLRSIAGNEEGQDLLEYALLAVLLSVAAITILTTLGGQVSDVFTSISGAISGALQ